MLKVYETKQVECVKCGWVGKVFKHIPLKYAWCGGCRSEGLRLYKSAPNKASTRRAEVCAKKSIVK